MDEAAFLALFDQYHNMVYRLALVSTRSTYDAEDIVQTVFMRLLTAKTPPMHGHERAWLATVTVNACRDLMRWKGRRKTEPLDENIPFHDPEESALFEAVSKLPQKLRTVIHLHYYEGYTCDEIASILRISPSGVSMRLYRARALLKSALKEEANETPVSKDL